MFLVCQAGVNYDPSSCTVIGVDEFFYTKRDCIEAMSIAKNNFNTNWYGIEVELVESKCLTWTMGSI